MTNQQKRISVISLFAGAGGMDYGFELAGFKTIWANDIDKDSCETHKNWSKTNVILGDISKLNLDTIDTAEVILGGFPCQGFSLAGPRKIDDKRNSLYRYFVSLVEKKKPLAFVAENVKGLLTMGNGKIITAIIEDFSNRGYTVHYKLLNAADYGVPQDRFRVIMVGIRKDLPFLFEYPQKEAQRTSLKEALTGAPIPTMNDICQAPYSPRFLSRNRKRSWEQVSFTIPAMAKQIALHPASPDMIKKDANTWFFSDPSKTRRFSWQEAAIIQTFPKDFVFEGDLISKYKQIGNAVPVLLANKIAINLYNALTKVL